MPSHIETTPPAYGSASNDANDAPRGASNDANDAPRGASNDANDAPRGASNDANDAPRSASVTFKVDAHGGFSLKVKIA